MNSQTIIMFFVGVGFIVVGYLLIAKESVARWGLNNGRARVWVKLLGEERAMKLTKFFFGPLCIVLGLATIAGSVVEYAAH